MEGGRGRPPSPQQGEGEPGPSIGPPGQPPSTEQPRTGSFNDDFVISRPATLTGPMKSGTTGKPINLITNYFLLKKRPNWKLFQYSVVISIEEPLSSRRRAYLRPHKPVIGPYVFDGTTLYTVNLLTSDPLVVTSTRKDTQEEFTITMKFIKEMEPNDPGTIQFYNVLIRSCQIILKMDQIGRNYYNREMSIKIDDWQLELWPGIITALRQHEKDTLLCVEVIHKVLRQDTVLDSMYTELHTDNPDWKSRRTHEILKDLLVGTIVMTTYNRKTYRVDDIDFEKTPDDSFPTKTGPKTFEIYYKEKYGTTIQYHNQPLLVSLPKARDVRRGSTGPILLVPELCVMTGLNEKMRANFNLMRDLSQYLHMRPTDRATETRDFVKKLVANAEVKTEMLTYGVAFDENLVRIPGRVLPKEDIVFANNEIEYPNDKADWTMGFRSKKMLSSAALTNWVLIFPAREERNIDNLTRTMQNVSRPLGFQIAPPSSSIRIQDVSIGSYIKEIETTVNREKDKLQMVVTVLPTNRIDLYAAIKNFCYVNYGIPSQCFLSKNVGNKGLMSICTKLVVQMNAKLGGEPWTIKNPLNDLMVIGYDIHHAAAGGKGGNIGAMVCTLNKALSKYFSCVSKNMTTEDASVNIVRNFRKCLNAYKEVNNDLPKTMIFYRSGVGDGQLGHVYRSELNEMKMMLKATFDAAGKPLPQFVFVVVTKKINTRLFSLFNAGPDNPPPGTVADDVITLPERWDFFLIAQSVRQGTISPTNYNIIFNKSALTSDQLQRITFKLCHLYYNWSGTVSVPAVCQYAKKLAFLVGTASKGDCHQNLCKLLYFL